MNSKANVEKPKKVKAEVPTMDEDGSFHLTEESNTYPLAYIKTKQNTTTEGKIEETGKKNKRRVYMETHRDKKEQHTNCGRGVHGPPAIANGAEWGHRKNKTILTSDRLCTRNKKKKITQGTHRLKLSVKHEKKNYFAIMEKECIIEHVEALTYGNDQKCWSIPRGDSNLRGPH